MIAALVVALAVVLLYPLPDNGRPIFETGGWYDRLHALQFGVRCITIAVGAVACVVFVPLWYAMGQR